MEKEDKELLLKDLCARLPYRVIVYVRYETSEPCYGKLSALDIELFINSRIKTIKPYLRPMSSMTEDEKKEYTSFCFEQPFLQKEKTPDIGSVPMCVNWLNAHHFDYRGLIEKDLAIEVTEENNPYQ